MPANDHPEITFTTPKGRAVWPKLSEPDTKWNADGEYSVTLAVPLKDAQGLMTQIDEVWDENYAYAKAENKKARESVHRPYSAEEDEDGNETGNILFKFKMKARVKSRATGKEIELTPKLFDATGAPCPGVNVGGGSTIRVNAKARGYYTGSIGAGVSLSLYGVQILDLKSFGGATAAEMGFDKEDGYTADQFVAADVGEDDGEF